MVTITTTDRSVRIAMPTFTWDVAKSRVKGQLPFLNGTKLLTELGDVDLFFDKVSADENTFDSAAALQDWVRENCYFKTGGGAPGEGVQSVTGSLVSGTAENPVIDMPDAGEVGADPAGSAATALSDANAYTDMRVGGVYRVMPAVATVGDLPTEGNSVGDVRDVLETGMNYVWTDEEAWDALASVFVAVWESITGKPAFMAVGATAAAARQAIGLGTASTQATGAFATAAQGALADSALQPSSEWFGTQAQYDALPSDKLTNGVKHYIEREED